MVWACSFLPAVLDFWRMPWACACWPCAEVLSGRGIGELGPRSRERKTFVTDSRCSSYLLMLGLKKPPSSQSGATVIDTIDTVNHLGTEGFCKPRAFARQVLVDISSVRTSSSLHYPKIIVKGCAFIFENSDRYKENRLFVQTDDSGNSYVYPQILHRRS